MQFKKTVFIQQIVFSNSILENFLQLSNILIRPKITINALLFNEALLNEKLNNTVVKVKKVTINWPRISNVCSSIAIRGPLSPFMKTTYLLIMFLYWFSIPNKLVFILFSHILMQTCIQINYFEISLH